MPTGLRRPYSYMPTWMTFFFSQQNQTARRFAVHSLGTRSIHT